MVNVRRMQACDVAAASKVKEDAFRGTSLSSYFNSFALPESERRMSSFRQFLSASLTELVAIDESSKVLGYTSYKYIDETVSDTLIQESTVSELWLARLESKLIQVQYMLRHLPTYFRQRTTRSDISRKIASFRQSLDESHKNNLYLPRSFVEEHNLDPQKTSYLAADSGKIVKYVYIAVLGVDPASQGHGVGKTLLQEATKLADEKGVPTVLESTAAGYPVYLKKGFIDIKRPAVHTDGDYQWTAPSLVRLPASKS